MNEFQVGDVVMVVDKPDVELYAPELFGGAVRILDIEDCDTSPFTGKKARVEYLDGRQVSERGGNVCELWIDRFERIEVEAEKKQETLPNTTGERKATPICSGVIDYFPAALAEVARVSKAGNDKHNPGQPLHHARGKSMDHADCIARHLIDRGLIDSETGMRHSAELAWRALALLQQELEDEGAPLARGAVV